MLKVLMKRGATKRTKLRGKHLSGWTNTCGKEWPIFEEQFF